MDSLATDRNARAVTVLVRRVQPADIPQVIALDARVTKLPKPEYWSDIFRR